MDVSTSSLLASVAVLGGVGTTFGALIALANARFRVEEDPRVDALSDILPGANCGACGFAGCRAFAEAVIDGRTPPARCTVMSEGEREDVGALLGVDATVTDRAVARLMCAGGHDVAPRKATYRGIESCAAAVAVSGGGKGCAWGCVGFADCEVACGFDAIHMGPNGLPIVDVDACTACNDCVEVCPLGLFRLLPLDTHLLVQCRNLLDGDLAEAVCSVACTGCRKCAQDAGPELIEIRQGLAVIDYDRIELENPAAIERCPTGAIVWVEGQQFPLLDPAHGVASGHSTHPEGMLA